MYCWCLIFIALTALAEVPSAVLAELDLQKRSEVALQEADEQISAAVQAYSKGPDLRTFEQHVVNTGELVELSLKSLQDSGKRASRSPKYFKRAELKLRALLRRLDTLEKEVSMDDRAAVEKVKTLVSNSHDQILDDIMAKR